VWPNSKQRLQWIRSPFGSQVTSSFGAKKTKVVPLYPIAGGHVENADGFVGGRRVDVAPVHAKLQIDDSAAVAGREHVKVVALTVDVPQD